MIHQKIVAAAGWWCTHDHQRLMSKAEARVGHPCFFASILAFLWGSLIIGSLKSSKPARSLRQSKKGLWNTHHSGSAKWPPRSCGSSHRPLNKLHIETRRHTSTPREERTCQLCASNEIESEDHFIVNCEAYSNIWNESSMSFDSYFTAEALFDMEDP